jgi:hypothetical protein
VLGGVLALPVAAAGKVIALDVQRERRRAWCRARRRAAPGVQVGP